MRFFLTHAIGVDKMVDKIRGHYLYLKRGIYYFSRHVPVDVRQHHECKRIVICLKTKSKNAANRAATSIVHKLDDYWLGLRLQTLPISMARPPAADPPHVSFSTAPSLSEALAAYLALKADEKGPAFVRTSTRNARYVIAELGDRPIDDYTSFDAARFRDALSAVTRSRLWNAVSPF